MLSIMILTVRRDRHGRYVYRYEAATRPDDIFNIEYCSALLLPAHVLTDNLLPEDGVG